MKSKYHNNPEPIRPRYWITNRWPLEGEGEKVNLFEKSKEELIDYLIQERQSSMDKNWNHPF